MQSKHVYKYDSDSMKSPRNQNFRYQEQQYPPNNKQQVLLQQLIINCKHDPDLKLTSQDPINTYQQNYLDPSSKHETHYSELAQMNTFLNIHQKESEKKLKQLLNCDRDMEQEQLLLEFHALQQEKINLAVQLDMLRAQQQIKPSFGIQYSYNHISDVQQSKFNQTPIFSSFSDPHRQSIKSEQQNHDQHASAIQFQKRDCMTTQAHTESFGKQVTHQDIFTPRKVNEQNILIDTESKVQVHQFSISKEQVLDQSCQCNLIEENLNSSQQSIKSHIKEKIKYKDEQIKKLTNIIEEQKSNYDNCLSDLESAHQQIVKYQEESEIKDSNKLQIQYDNLAARYNELKYNNRDPEMEALIRRLQDQIALITNEMKQASMEYKSQITTLTEQHDFQILQYQNKIKELERDGHSNYHNSSLLQENQFLAQQLSYIQEELTNARQTIKDLKDKKPIKTITSNGSTPRMSSKAKIETDKEALTREINIWKNKYEAILDQNEGLQEQINEQYNQYESIVLQLQEQINRLQDQQKFHHEDSFKLVESSHKSQNLLESYHKSPNFVSIDPKVCNAKYFNSNKIMRKKQQRSWSQSSDKEIQNEMSNTTSQNTYQTSLVLLQQYELNRIKKILLQKNYDIDRLKQQLVNSQSNIDNQQKVIKDLEADQQIMIESKQDHQNANQQSQEQARQIGHLKNMLLFDQLEIVQLESESKRDELNLMQQLQEQLKNISQNQAQCTEHEGHIIQFKLDENKLKNTIKQLEQDRLISDQQLEQIQIENENLNSSQKSLIFELQRQILKLTKINAQLIQNINNTISTEELNKQLKGKIEDLNHAKENYTNTYANLQDLEFKLITQLEANEQSIL